jgi:hypothetical protein
LKLNFQKELKREGELHWLINLQVKQQMKKPGGKNITTTSFQMIRRGRKRVLKYLRWLINGRKLNDN